MSKEDNEGRDWFEKWFDKNDKDFEELDLSDFDWEAARKRSIKKRFQEALKDHPRKDQDLMSLGRAIDHLMIIVDGLQEQIEKEKKALKKGKTKKYKKLRDQRHKIEREIKENWQMDNVEKVRRWKYGI